MWGGLSKGALRVAAGRGGSAAADLVLPVLWPPASRFGGVTLALEAVHGVVEDGGCGQRAWVGLPGGLARVWAGAAGAAGAAGVGEGLGAAGPTEGPTLSRRPSPRPPRRFCVLRQEHCAGPAGPRSRSAGVAAEAVPAARRRVQRRGAPQIICRDGGAVAEQNHSINVAGRSGQAQGL